MAELDSRKTPPDPELAGHMAGEYRIIRRLGSGGFGTVYEAEHPLLKRKAAVKVLHASRSVDSGAVARFIAEAQSASQIKHRHIVDIFSFGTLPGGRQFYVMELLQGAPLDRYLKERTRLPPEVAIPLLRPIADALDALHAAGVIHRDVKPPNIFLSWESSDEVVPKLLDFGLVKLVADSPIQTASGVPMGTPFYMSPEQCRGEKIDARADVYAFGVICHELLTGRRPFSGDTPTSVLVAHIVQPPPRMSEVRPELAPELDEPVLQMLAKDADQRPSSVGEALKRLEDAAKRAGIELPPSLPHLPRPSSPPESERATSSISSDLVVRSTDRTATRGTADTEAAAGQLARSRRLGYAALTWGGAAVALGIAAVSVFQMSPREPDTASAASAEPVPAPLAGPSLATSAPPPVAPSAAPPASVGITVRGAPQGASLSIGDREIGATPGPVEVPYGEKPVEITVKAPGYEPATVEIVPSASAEAEVSLPKARRAPKRSSTPSDLENPF